MRETAQVCYLQAKTIQHMKHNLINTLEVIKNTQIKMPAGFSYRHTINQGRFCSIFL